MKIPPNLTAGDSATWTDASFNRADGQLVSSGNGWTLNYALRGPNTSGIDLVGTTQGSGWSFTMSKAQSAGLNATPLGVVWYWQAFATFSTTDRVTAGDGTLIVKPNLALLPAGTAYDGSSPAEQILTAIEAEIKARATGGMTVEYTIGSRSLKKEPIAALLTLRSTYRLIVSRERIAQATKNGLGNPGRVGVRFK